MYGNNEIELKLILTKLGVRGTVNWRQSPVVASALRDHFLVLVTPDDICNKNWADILWFIEQKLMDQSQSA